MHTSIAASSPPPPPITIIIATTSAHLVPGILLPLVYPRLQQVYGALAVLAKVRGAAADVALRVQGGAGGAHVASVRVRACAWRGPSRAASCLRA